MPMRLSRCLFFCVLCSLTASLFGQMTPNAPIKNFRLPRFADNGYTQWVLQGERGIYDSEEQVRVEGMAMRVYSGDERMALELSMDSPEATLRLQENRGFSDSPIEIVGANFKISGVGWEWSGETKEVVVKYDTVVTFTQGIAGAFVDGGEVAESASQTEIQSERLVLRTTDEEYYFEFTGSVRAVSDQMDLRSEQLIALADAPEARDKALPTVAPNELDSIRQIMARDDVVILQAGKTVKADEAEFFPREQRANLSGAVSVETKGAYLSGETIRSRSGEIVIAGAEGKGRAQMILVETGGLGIQGASALSSETIILADSITMREQATENHFLFKGSVEVMSGAVQMRAARMTIVAVKSESGAAVASDSDLKVGEVKNIVADCGVRIEQSGQIATGEKVTFYPSEERAVLTGGPKVTNGEAVVTGQTMELKPKLAIIRGDAGEPVVVRLPEMPDLGYEAFTPKVGQDAKEPKAEAPDAAPQETIVSSHLLRMIEEPERTLFRFTDNVEVAATNLDATCDRLDVIAQVAANPDSNTQMPLELQSIEAHDNVAIKQTGRTATSNKAFILPKEGKVVLEGKAIVHDERGTVSGHRMTLLQGQRRAIVEGGGPEGERARITLPAMPSGN